MTETRRNSEETDRATAAQRTQFSPSQRMVLTVAAIGITVLVLRLASGLIVPILLALVVTMAVSPFLHWMMRHRVPPFVAWLITAILTTAAVAFVFVLAGVGVARLIGELSNSTSPLSARLDQAITGLDHIGIKASGLIGPNGLLSPERLVHIGLVLLKAFRSVLGGVLLTLLIVYFMLAESTTLQLKFSMTPPAASPTLQRLELFTRDMRAFVQATSIIGAFNGLAVGVFLWAVGVDFPVLWGVWAFFMTFIPTLGFFLAVLPPALLALVTGSWQDALIVLLGFLAIYIVTGSMRSGRFVGRRLNLSPLVILLSILLWGWVFGIMGSLLAVPMTLLVRRLFVEAFDESRWMTDLLGRPARAVDAELGGADGAPVEGDPAEGDPADLSSR
jgi:AI-2 transport protein TqsA